jgi:predicted O-linked N-acetylglucosamine transferase (SPINDLY family)
MSGRVADQSRARLERGLAAQKSGRLAEAEAAYREVLDHDPENADALHLLGLVAGQRGELVDAVRLLKRATALRPDMAPFHNNLGKALDDSGDLPAAIASFRKAASLAPSYVPALMNLASALRTVERFEAERTYRQVLAVSPSHAGARKGLAEILQKTGRPTEARATYAEALSDEPGDAECYRSLLTAALYDPALGQAERFALHRAFGERFAAPTPAAAFPNVPDPNRRLRIGWLSADLSRHPVARNVWPLFSNLDPDRVVSVCYADIAREDDMTARFKSAAQGWRDIKGRSDAEAADLIRRDEIDILLVLAGRFDRNRPLVAALRPAPLLVSFHDPATSGLPLDYLVADPLLAPRRTSEGFTERVVRLPHFYIHDPIAGVPDIGGPPAARHGYVTFASFNNPAKLNDAVLDLWRQLLQRLPRAHIRFGFQDWYADEGLRQRMLTWLGIAPERVEFRRGLADYQAHLAAYEQIDVALDPFPFTGSTTTFEALSVGVPVVTLWGDAMVGRWSASLLHTLKLDGLIARTPAEYVAIAERLAQDPAQLAAFRGGLPARVATSPLCDGRSYARHFERLLRMTWRRWCAAGRKAV